MTRLETAIEKAKFAFWKTVAESYPEATSGDLSLGAVIALRESAYVAVKEWVENNVLDFESWRRQRKWCDHIEVGHTDGSTVEGFVYPGGKWIQHFEGRWMTVLGNQNPEGELGEIESQVFFWEST